VPHGGISDQTDTQRLQRAGILARLPELLAELGVATKAVFGGSGIDPQGLSPAALVPLSAMLAVLHQASRLAGRDDIGLLLGSRFSLDIHGVLGRLMRCAPTLRHALLDFVRWQVGYSSASVVYLIPFGDDMALGYGSYSSGEPGVREVQDAVIAVGMRMLRELTDGAATAAEALLSHRPPGDLTPYARLGIPVRFDQPQTCLVLSAHSLSAKLPEADAGRHASLQAEIEAAMPAPTFAARVRREVRPALYRGQPGMAAAAQSLQLTPRTLRRRLAAEGQDFSTLRDEMRLTMACELLRMTGLPMGDIALALAFASHGAFIAAFRRWTGTSPSAWRGGEALQQQR
jgi:AraC-like DNA-binding protein